MAKVSRRPRAGTLVAKLAKTKKFFRRCKEKVLAVLRKVKIENP